MSSWVIEKKCKGKCGGKLRGIVRRNGKPFGIVIVINSHHHRALI